MAKAGDVVWITPPASMAKNLDAYGDKVLVAVRAVADFIAGKMQDHARTQAPWEDRTGNARTGIFGSAVSEAAGDIVTVYLSHGFTVYYGIFLELGHGGKYAVIMPTIEKFMPEIKKMLDDIFR